MQNISVPRSDWGGQLPPHIAKNEQIWWGMFPRIKPDYPKMFQLFGGAKEPPPRETIGKVVLVAHIKAELGNTGLLLRDWGCLCTLMEDRMAMHSDYMAGTTEPRQPPSLIFSVPWGLFVPVLTRFIVRTNQEQKLSEAERYELAQRMTETDRKLGIHVEECPVNITKFKHSPWENGLDITFKAAIWLTSNREEALKSIWGIPV